MLHSNFKSALVKPLMLVFMALTAFSYAGIAGGDTYEIYLNNKLVLRQHVWQASSSIMNLQLDKVDYKDQLVINYSHCGVTGKGRNIIIKDEKNQVLKEWKFADAKGSDRSMSIPVKDLLELKKKNPNAKLQLCYSSSEQLPKGLTLASIMLENKSVTQHPPKERKNA